MFAGDYPPGVTGDDIGRLPFGGPDGSRTCYGCAHCLYEVADFGVCGLDEPCYIAARNGLTLSAMLDWLDSHRVDMREDSCPNWKEA